MNTLPTLAEIIRRRTETEMSPALQALVRELHERHDPSVCAILFYGSCLRSGDHYDGLVDLYVLVDSYRSSYGYGPRALFNWLLPPNVFYLEAKVADRIARAKYAVVSIQDFQRGTSLRWFHSYLWGRFAQPVGIAYVRDEETAERIWQSLAQAVLTFVTRVLPRLPASFTASQLWQEGLLLSYRAELRVEKSDRTKQLFQAAASYYDEITPVALEAAPYPIAAEANPAPPRYRVQIARPTRVLNRIGWLTRQAQGKLLSVLRLIKAFFTFTGGLDYIVWKLERHSGTKIEVSERVRRYPLIFVWGMFWRLYRRGVFR